MRMKVRASELRDGDAVVVRTGGRSNIEHRYTITDVARTVIDGEQMVVMTMHSSNSRIAPEPCAEQPRKWVEVDRLITIEDVGR